MKKNRHFMRHSRGPDFSVSLLKIHVFGLSNIKILQKILPLVSTRFWQNKTKLLTIIIKAYKQVFMGLIRRYEKPCWQLAISIVCRQCHFLPRQVSLTYMNTIRTRLLAAISIVCRQCHTTTKSTTRTLPTSF